MPNPMFLQVMGVSLSEYNSYSNAKKAKFQKTAQDKLVKLHESNITAYTRLTGDTVKAQVRAAEQLAESDAEDKENE